MRLAARHSSKIAVVSVSTPESELQFNVPVKSKCKFLFDLVVSTLGVRETWYFGLLYDDWTISCPLSHRKPMEGNDGERHITWLKLNKTLPCKKSSLGGVVAIRLHFLPKLFPELVERDLIQTTTRHLFYLYVRQQLMGERQGDDPMTSAVCSISVPSSWIVKEPTLEEDLTLGAYALQSEFGDFEDHQVIPTDEDIPQPQSYSISNNSMIVPWLSEMQLAALPVSLTRRLTTTNLSQLKLKYKECMGMHREEAEVEYLKTAFDSNLVGLTYFSVTEKQKYIRGLSVSAHGVQFYTCCNCQNTPVRSIPWAFITHVSVKDRRVSIKLLNSSVNTPFPVRSTAPASTYGGASDFRSIMQTPAISAPSSTPTADCFTLSRSCPGLTVQDRPHQNSGNAVLLPSTSPGPEVTTSVMSHTTKDRSVDSTTFQHTSISHQHHTSHDRSQRFFCFHGNQGSHSSCSSLLNVHASANPPQPSSTSHFHLQPPLGTAGLYDTKCTTTTIKGAASSLWKTKLSQTVQPHQHRSTSISEVSVAASGISHSKKCLLHFNLSSAKEAALILDLCAGQHELYLRWRQSDTVEIQQMRNVAKEEKRRRELDANRLARITHEKESAVRVRNELETRCADLERKLKSSQDEQQKLVTRVHEADLIRKRIEHYLSTSHLPQVDVYGILGSSRDDKIGNHFEGALRNGGSLGQLQYPSGMASYFGTRFNHEMSPLAFTNGRRHPGGGPMTGVLPTQPATILEASHYAARPEAFLVNNVPDYGGRDRQWGPPLYQSDMSSSRPNLHSRPAGLQPGGSMPVLRQPLQQMTSSHVTEQTSHDSFLGKSNDSASGNIGSSEVSGSISRSHRTPWQHSQSTYASPLLGGTIGNPRSYDYPPSVSSGLHHYNHASRIRSHQILPSPFRLVPGLSVSALQSSSHALRQPFLSSVPSLHRPSTVPDYAILPGAASLSHLSTEQLRAELANERARFTVLSDDFAQGLSLAWQQWHRAREICCPNWYPNDLAANEASDELQAVPAYVDADLDIDAQLYTNLSPDPRNSPFLLRDTRPVNTEFSVSQNPRFSEQKMEQPSSQNKTEMEFLSLHSQTQPLEKDDDYLDEEGVSLSRPENGNVNGSSQTILASPQPCEAIIVSSKVPHLLRHASSCASGVDIKRSGSLQQRLT